MIHFSPSRVQHPGRPITDGAGPHFQPPVVRPVSRMLSSPLIFSLRARKKNSLEAPLGSGLEIIHKLARRGSKQLYRSTTLGLVVSAPRTPFVGPACFVQNTIVRSLSHKVVPTRHRTASLSIIKQPRSAKVELRTAVSHSSTLQLVLPNHVLLFRPQRHTFKIPFRRSCEITIYWYSVLSPPSRHPPCCVASGYENQLFCKELRGG